MPRIFFHLAFLLFALTAITGIWMRAIPFLSNSWLHYEHILHGHSHIAILGWAFFGLYIVFLSILWPNIQKKRQATLLAVAIFVVSVLMFFAFLYEGYATYSIIMSTLHIFIEYWAAYFIYQQIKIQMNFPKVGKMFIYGSLIALMISSLGPFALGYFGAMGMRDTSFFDMSIYFFLHFQYNGWLFLCVIGLFIFILHRKKINLVNPFIIYGFWVYVISLFPWYLSAILWADVGLFIRIIANIGSIGQIIGVLLIIFGIRNVWSHLQTSFPTLSVLSIRSALLLLLIKSLMEVGLVIPALSELVFNTRSVIIGYLHLVLLGFISLMIIILMQMVQVIDAYKETALIGTIVFAGGFIVNELALFFMGLTLWTNMFQIPYYHETLLIASILLLIGICIFWMSMPRKYEKLI